HGPAREVPRGARVLRGAKDVDRAGLVGIVRDPAAALEGLALEVGVAPGVKGHGRITAGLPVLAGNTAEVCATGKADRRRRVVPGGAAVQAEAAAAATVAATVVVVTRDNVHRV